MWHSPFIFVLFIPENLNVETINGIIKVDKEEAFEKARRIAKVEGILVCIST